MLDSESHVISRDHANLNDVRLAVAIKEKCFMIDIIH